MACVGPTNRSTWAPLTQIFHAAPGDELEYATHAAARQLARVYLAPVMRAHDAAALASALHSTPRYVDVVEALCAWITATPRCLESLPVAVPHGAKALDYPTLDLYLAPRLFGALAMLYTHLRVGHAASDEAMTYSAALLDEARAAASATMRLLGVVCHLCLASSHRPSHVRYVVFDTLRCATRGLYGCGTLDASGAMSLPLPPCLGVPASDEAWVLCGPDDVPESYALPATTPAVLTTRAAGTPPYAWSSEDVACCRLAAPPALAAPLASSLVLLCARVSAELGSVYPAALLDLVDLSVRVSVVECDAQSGRLTELYADAMLAALPVLDVSPPLFHVARQCMAPQAYEDLDTETTAHCERLLRALQLRWHELRRTTPSWPPEADGVLGDPRVLLTTLLHRVAELEGTAQQCCVAHLDAVLALLHRDVLSTAEWDTIDSLHDDHDTAWEYDRARLCPVSPRRSVSPSLHVTKARRLSKETPRRAHPWADEAAAVCGALPCRVCDAPAPAWQPTALPSPAADKFVRSDWGSHVALSTPAQAMPFLHYAFRCVVHATPVALAAAPVPAALKLLRTTAVHVHRGVRWRAALLLSVLVARYSSLERDEQPEHMAEHLEALVRVAVAGALGRDAKVQETSLVALAWLGRLTHDAVLSLVLPALVQGLFLPHVYLRALVATEITQLAVQRRCTSFQLLSPYLDLVCDVALSAKGGALPSLHEIARLVGMSASTFLQTTLGYTLPRLLEEYAGGTAPAGAALEALAAAVGQSVPGMCVAHVSHVFQHLYMLAPDVRERSLAAFLALLGTHSVTVASLLRSRLHDVLGWLVMHLGSAADAERACEGLECVCATMTHTGKWRGMDLTAFLQEEVLAILTWINDELGGVHGKARVARRAMAVRSIGALVQQVGAVAARVAPQVLASLSSTLQEPPLALPTLESWLDVVRALEGSDLAVLVGPTAASLLHVWPQLDLRERRVAGDVLRCAISERTTDPSVLDDVPSLDSIEADVPDVAQRVRATRRVWDDEAYFQHILDRVAHDSAAICVQSLHELRTFLQERRGCVEAWTTGNVFHALVGRCVRALMAVAARTELSPSVPPLCLECLGLLGAVDPDRLEMPPEEPIFVLLSDFDNVDESIGFAQRLLVDLVVPAFRATSDTKHQAALAYAIQELLKFCQFTPALLEANAPSRVMEKVRRRWAQLPEDILPTLMPLLNSRYVVQLAEPRARAAPFYVHTTSYRDWIQSWTLALIRQARAGDAATLFGLFASVVRDYDVGISQWLLPHLVLHTLVSGDDAQRRAVLDEARAVLADQAAPTLGFDAERRRLSAQTLFTVLDHVGHWMRRMRLVPPRSTKRGRLRDALGDVQATMDELSPDLLAQASLQCHAYARALLHFESRVRATRTGPDAAALQSYYETMHEIYASLDDPDGMEGISTKVLSPSLEHQIREHESTGRWTDAQSCWEVELQQRPDDLRLHLGLLRCLRNLGHYDTMRTHIRGVLAVHNAWQPQLAPFQVEGACILADWAAVRDLAAQSHAVPELGMARALLAMRESDQPAFQVAISEARTQWGRHVIGPARVSYTQAYDAISQLHMLSELEQIFQAPSDAAVQANLDARFAATLPSFRTREPILSLRRSALRACHASQEQLGACWILSAKTARKAGHTQSAYSAILQAGQCGAPFAFVQQAKLLADSDQVQSALQVLNHALLQEDRLASDAHQLAQAHLLRARLVEETARFQQNDIIQHYKTCTSLDPESEKIWYYLGHFYDAPGGGLVGNQMLLQLSVCRFYMKSAQHGTKFLYRTLPRMLTIWLDAGNELAEAETPGEDDTRQTQQQFDKINDMMLKSVRHLARYQWFAVLPQLMARIVHKNEAVWRVLLEIIVAVVVAYPQQGVWALLAGSHSKDKRRKQRYEQIVQKISSVAERAYRNVVPLIESAERLSTELLNLCDFHVHKETALSMQRQFPALLAAVQMTPLILPLQSSLNVILPPNNQVTDTHRPFPTRLPMIQGFDDTVEIMHSLQKPRKIVVHASDGRRYPFLCKPRDDLRKDARLMEFDAMINKLLQSNSEARRRRLCT